MSSDGKEEKNRKDGKSQSHLSQNSHSSHPAPEDRIIPPRGDPRTLLSFQKAEVVYDLTYRFAHKFLARGDRTIDQMIQAARSGKANILEGSKAGRTSKEMEIKLTNVARASLDELLDDYCDYLRVREFPQWGKDSKEALYVRQLGRKTPITPISSHPSHPRAHARLHLPGPNDFRHGPQAPAGISRRVLSRHQPRQLQTVALYSTRRRGCF